MRSLPALLTTAVANAGNRAWRAESRCPVRPQPWGPARRATWHGDEQHANGALLAVMLILIALALPAHSLTSMPSAPQGATSAPGLRRNDQYTFAASRSQRSSKLCGLAGSGLLASLSPHNHGSGVMSMSMPLASSCASRAHLPMVTIRARICALMSCGCGPS